MYLNSTHRIPPRLIYNTSVLQSVSGLISFGSTTQYQQYHHSPSMLRCSSRIMWILWSTYNLLYESTRLPQYVNFRGNSAFLSFGLRGKGERKFFLSIIFFFYFRTLWYNNNPNNNVWFMKLENYAKGIKVFISYIICEHCSRVYIFTFLPANIAAGCDWI